MNRKKQASCVSRIVYRCRCRFITMIDNNLLLSKYNLIPRVGIDFTQNIVYV